VEGGPEGETVQRALSIHPASESPQDDASDTLHRWTERRRELLLEERLEHLTTALEHLVSALERRAP